MQRRDDVGLKEGVQFGRGELPEVASIGAADGIDEKVDGTGGAIGEERPLQGLIDGEIGGDGFDGGGAGIEELLLGGL